MSDQQYNELIKEHIVMGTSPKEARRIKRRKILSNVEPIEINSQSSADEGKAQTVISADEGKAQTVISADEFDELSSDDFKDVELEEAEEGNSSTMPDFPLQEKEDDSITVALNKPEVAKPKRKVVVVSKEERQFRMIYHKMYLAAMVVHGITRNRWCSDKQLLERFKPMITPEIKSLLFQDMQTKVLSNVRSRRFLDGMKMLLMSFSSKFKCTSKGIIRRSWNELSMVRRHAERNMTITKFRSHISKFKGSRDLGAQGFLCLLRAAGLNARLVFSLQPPDYTSIAANLTAKSTNANESNSKSQGVKTNKLVEKFRTRNARMNFLSGIRQQPTQTTQQPRSKDEPEDSEYPIFWVEVFNKYNKKWLSVDPITLKTMEVTPMRRKSKFEPPSTDQRNQMTYAIAFDRIGVVKDVTRRYSQFYNAKTIKRKIQYRSEEDEHWYNRLIEGASLGRKRDRIRKTDISELKEFHDRDLAEGFPNNIQDFKNHPLYVLESQLRQDEIIYPREDSTKCGMFRTKSTSKKSGSLHTIYKRSAVHRLRSARRWFMLGRVLKVGVQPLKIKRKNSQVKQVADEHAMSDNEDEEEDIVRLYAEFQTQLYVPPPIQNGVIPKNAYGNIDIYTPSMIPENGYFIRSDGKYPIKLAERAAQSILNIDYAKAIVAFDFGNQKKTASRATAREGGIVIDKEFKEAMILVMDHLLEEAEERARELTELQSLKIWKFFLTNLRITHRLNKEHGSAEESSSSGSPSFRSVSDSPKSEQQDPDSLPRAFEDSESAFEEERQNHLREVTQDESTAEEIPDPIFANSIDFEEPDSVSDSSSIDMGGGFFMDKSATEPQIVSEIPLGYSDTTGIIPTEAQTETISVDNEGEDLPDAFFSHDEDGNLIYNPQSTNDETRSPTHSSGDPQSQKATISNHENCAGCNTLRENTTMRNPNPELNLSEVAIAENYSAKSSPGSWSEEEHTLPDHSISRDVEVEADNEVISLSDSAVEELEKEEEKYGFDYSDSE